MTWTYSGDPGASTLDEVRFLIQDTDTDDQLLQDEELNYLIDSYGDPYSAAVAAVVSLIAAAARSEEESKRVGESQSEYVREAIRDRLKKTSRRKGVQSV